MKRSFVFLLALGVLSIAAPAAAAPQLGVSDCRAKSRACTCADAPFMEVFVKNQQKSREAWAKVFDTIGTSTGPRSIEEASAAHSALFPGDSRVIAQYKTCPSYDPSANLAQFAGVSLPGTVWVDQCACEAFCTDIIDATIAHELTHPPTILLGLDHFAEEVVLCGVGLLPQAYCDTIQPTIIVASELASYSVGNLVLESAIRGMRKTANPAKPSELCTWQPIATFAPPSKPSREAPPENMWARLVNLADRFWNGTAS